MKQAPIFRLSSHLHFIFSISLIPLSFLCLDVSETWQMPSEKLHMFSTVLWTFPVCRFSENWGEWENVHLIFMWCGFWTLICHKTIWQRINIPDSGKDNGPTEDIMMYLRLFHKKKLGEIWEVFFCNVRCFWSMSLSCCIIVPFDNTGASCQSRTFHKS